MEKLATPKVLLVKKYSNFIQLVPAKRDTAFERAVWCQKEDLRFGRAVAAKRRPLLEELFASKTKTSFWKSCLLPRGRLLFC